MKELFRFVRQILLLLFFTCLSMKTAHAAVHYKFPSVYLPYGGNLSSWADKGQAMLVHYTDWCNWSISAFINDELNRTWNSNSVPLITWEIVTCIHQGQSGIIKAVNNHSFDGYLDEFSGSLKKWLAGPDGIYGNNDDRRAYLRLAHEMNGNWYPWSLDSTPSEYVLAWHYVYDFLSNKGFNSTRLQWVWSVSTVDVGPYTAEEYWVGDNYVDWLGIDGYNFGASQWYSKWQWPNEVFDNMIGRLHNLSSTKPISINEYGSSSIRTTNVSDIASKTEWLNQFCDYMSNSSDVKMAAYFNIDEETDWAIFGGMRGDVVWNNFKAYSAYKSCLLTEQWIGTNVTNPRLLTDEQFAGRF